MYEENFLRHNWCVCVCVCVCVWYVCLCVCVCVCVCVFVLRSITLAFNRQGPGMLCPTQSMTHSHNKNVSKSQMWKMVREVMSLSLVYSLIARKLKVLDWNSDIIVYSFSFNIFAATSIGSLLIYSCLLMQPLRLQEFSRNGKWLLTLSFLL
jgi:hypothetical protein